MLNYYQMLNVLPKIIPFLAAIAALYVPMSVGRWVRRSVGPSVGQQQVSRSVIKLLNIETRCLQTDRQTDRPTDRPTDMGTYRAAFCS